MNTETAVRTWQDATLVAKLLAIDPHGFGGVWVKSFASDVRKLWWQYTQTLFAQGSVQSVPAGVDDEALLGGLDLTQTLAQGRPVYQIGLLEKPSIQLLRLTMAERLRHSAASYITQSFDRPNCQFGMVVFDESTAEEEGVATKLIERCAFQLRLDHLSYFLVQEIDEVTDEDLENIRRRYQQITLTEDVIESIIKAGQAFGVESLRALLFVMKAVRAVTALRGVEVPEVEDIQMAIRLVFTHRITSLPSAPEDASTEPEETEPEDPECTQEPPAPETPEDNPTNSNESTIEQQMLEDMLIEAAKAYLPTDILDTIVGNSVTTRSSHQQQGKSGDAQISYTRGIPLPARKGMIRSGQKIDFLKTIQAASPWQTIRRQTQTSRQMAFKILPEDLHIKRYEQRKTTLTLFVVDASGSTALERLAEAKGAVELLLAHCYVRRDEVALMTFRVNRAELVLPPTRSLVRAKRLLTMMAGGGGTPLALAIRSAGQFLSGIQKDGQTPLMILITDARANVSLSGIGGRELAFSDALQAAEQYRVRGIKSILIDTAIMPQDNAKTIAGAMGATYVPLPRGRSDKVVEIAKQVSK